MGEIRFDCPHVGCRTKNVAFETLVSRPINETITSVFAQCTQCKSGIVLEVIRIGSGSPNFDPYNANGDAFERLFGVLRVHPAPPTLESVDDLPGEIAATYEEAEGSFVDARYRSAAAMYRTAMELSLKELDPNGKGNLYSRIEAMAKNNAVPKTLIDLMHEVRFLGNNGVHGPDPVTADDVERGRDFIRLFLVYTFELPKKIAEATKERSA